MASTVTVEMGETAISCSADIRLQAVGLGACVGLCLHETAARIAVLVHVVLPVTLPPSSRSPVSPLPGKCADTAVAHALSEITRHGGNLAMVQAALVGGAQIFTMAGSDTGTRSRLEIGLRNVQAVKDELRRAGIPVSAEDTGGHFGRTVTFDAWTGTIVVRPVGLAERTLVTLGQRSAFTNQPAEKTRAEGTLAYGN